MWPFTSTPKFTADLVPDLTGRVCIVTGGNTGIGYATCAALLNKNATVYLACRSKERAEAAIAKLEQEYGKKAHFMQLDLQDLNQIKNAAETFVKKGIALDILINNAGIMACPWALTKDGVETQFGTNHLGHFLFTKALLPAILKAKKPRIVNVSSTANKMAPTPGIDFENLDNENAMSTFARYGQSKLANILFTRELKKRYGDKIHVNSLHPGVVDTELFRGVVDTMGGPKSWLYFFTSPILALSKFALLTPQQGATASLYCATSPEIEEKGYNGLYFHPFGVLSQDLHPRATDDSLAEKLWEHSEKLLKEKKII